MREFVAEVEVSEEAAVFIASGLRELAAVDGVHERELALIEAFAAGLVYEPVPFDLTGDHPLVSDELRDLFMRSAILLALADGGVSELEGDLIGRYALALEISPRRLAMLWRDVKCYLLSSFEAAEIFRDDVEQIGRELGLADSEIHDSLK